MHAAAAIRWIQAAIESVSDPFLADDAYEAISQLSASNVKERGDALEVELRSKCRIIVQVDFRNL